MNCIEARDAMLVAEVAEMHGVGDTLLAAHLSECDSCRAVATRLSHDLDRLTAAVLMRAPAKRRSRRLMLLAGIPIAAALLVTVTLAVRRQKPADVPSAARLGAARGVSVDVSRGQQATVISTNDPTVTVVWLSPGGSQ